MTELQIPEEFKPGFKLLISIDEKTLQGFIDAFQQAQPLQINDLVSAVTSRVNTLTKKEVKDVIETLISIHNLRDYLQENNDASTDEVVAKISQAVENDEEVEITKEQKQEFERRLVTFLDFDSILNFTSKAIEVIRDHERLFQNSRIHTDMRPVFESDLEDSTAAVAIVNMLKIEYVDLDGKHEFFVALDANDLKQLREQLDIADRKVKAIESMLNKANIPYLNDLDVE
ncbi:hypothetical protein IQ227_09525 [Anabaena aphanizomenioides LEGE 00250]|uniref:Uncharacterized protein n=2 Tax=Sphaerospermopsis TaxID=752201 RepID=A0ABR9VCP2_9CYAN|nr:hypothetical protein [Sphaerospermopsis aphanizomenoides]MBE9236264.1 hypothetical protein [Sphaerospermopsis aphanizomenoides LEGE 00250]